MCVYLPLPPPFVILLYLLLPPSPPFAVLSLLVYARTHARFTVNCYATLITQLVPAGEKSVRRS